MTEPVTRRLPRPARPTQPAQWTRLDPLTWSYEGMRADVTVKLESDDEGEVLARIEVAEATMELLRYLRRDLSWLRRHGAAVTAAPPSPTTCRDGSSSESSPDEVTP